MTQDRKPGDVVQREGELGDVLYFGDDDPAMRAAIAKARMRRIVECDEVIDWIVATETTYRGGFTNRVVRDRATPEERARIDARWNLLPE